MKTDTEGGKISPHERMRTLLWQSIDRRGLTGWSDRQKWPPELVMAMIDAAERYANETTSDKR